MNRYLTVALATLGLAMAMTSKDQLFASHPKGWTCGDRPFAKEDISYQVTSVDENDRKSLRDTMMKFMQFECAKKCRVLKSCRMVTLTKLPVFAKVKAGLETFYTCNMFNSSSCQVMRWPDATSSKSIIKIAGVKHYDFFQKKCDLPVYLSVKGNPEYCAQLCIYNGLCAGFNYKYADNFCFMVYYADKSIIANLRSGIPPDACPAEHRADSEDQVFFSKTRTVLEEYWRDFMQDDQDFHGLDGNCRGGVNPDLTGTKSESGTPLAKPIFQANKIECIAACRKEWWCKGVSVHISKFVDKSTPSCFLKSFTCEPNEIARDAVYQFFQKDPTYFRG